jgi:hypothetical protein
VFHDPFEEERKNQPMTEYPIQNIHLGGDDAQFNSKMCSSFKEITIVKENIIPFYLSSSHDATKLNFMLCNNDNESEAERKNVRDNTEDKNNTVVVFVKKSDNICPFVQNMP